jgi:uncharacterized RDD family membrane protein YckC
MTDIAKQLDRLTSPNKNKRYDACEELRVASDLPPEAISALEAASNDPETEVADAARRALLAHQQVETPSISIAADSESSAELEVNELDVGKKFGRRAGAYILDSVFYNVIFFVIYFFELMMTGLILSLSGQAYPVDAQSNLCLNLVISFVLFFLYFVIFEWLFGATPGKLILGMRVIQQNGAPCRLGAALIRGLLRFIDGFFFGMVAFSVMHPPLYQRVGDKTAKTIVVGAKDAVIQRPREWWWFLIASGIYLALDAIISLFMIIANIR